MNGPLAAEPSPRSLRALLITPIIVALSVSAAAQTPPPAGLWSALEQAQAASDGAEVTRILRAWATLGSPGTPPEGLRGPAEQAQAWANQEGPLRVFVSRVSPSRVRVGVDDPAHAVDRLDVFSVAADGQVAQMTRAESEAAGRNEYTMPEGPPRAVRVEALMLGSGGRIVLQTVELPAEPAGLPAAPTPAAPSPAAAVLPSPVPAPTAAADIPWWWIAASAVAAGLVGAAVWQETRF